MWTKCQHLLLLLPVLATCWFRHSFTGRCGLPSFRDDRDRRGDHGRHVLKVATSDRCFLWACSSLHLHFGDEFWTSMGAGACVDPRVKSCLYSGVASHVFPLHLPFPFESSRTLCPLCALGVHAAATPSLRSHVFPLCPHKPLLSPTVLDFHHVVGSLIPIGGASWMDRIADHPVIGAFPFLLRLLGDDGRLVSEGSGWLCGSCQQCWLHRFCGSSGVGWLARHKWPHLLLFSRMAAPSFRNSIVTLTLLTISAGYLLLAAPTLSLRLPAPAVPSHTLWTKG